MVPSTINGAGTVGKVEVLLRAAVAHARLLAEGDLSPHFGFEPKERIRITSRCKDAGMRDMILLHAIAVHGGSDAPAISCRVHVTVHPIWWWSVWTVEMLRATLSACTINQLLMEFHQPAE